MITVGFLFFELKKLPKNPLPDEDSKSTDGEDDLPLDLDGIGLPVLGSMGAFEESLWASYVSAIAYRRKVKR